MEHTLAALQGAGRCFCGSRNVSFSSAGLMRAYAGRSVLSNAIRAAAIPD